MKKQFYITTPIYYPSSTLHLGHAYTTTIADVLARYKRKEGYEVFFSTGSDEHGQKIAKKAAENNIAPQDFVDKIVIEFKDLWEKLNIKYDNFIRTTDKNHITTVQQIFSRLLKQEDIYLGKYEGWYCSSCEEFVIEHQFKDNKHLCPNCSSELSKLSEESYFLKISKYIKQLLDYYKSHPTFIWPDSRKTEMLHTFIKPGLSDLSVSRTSFDWGVQVLENPKHIIYVWVDALSNYLTTLGYLTSDDSNFKKFWESEECEIVQLAGKEITRFHTIYWPILLIALGFRQPNKILIHGWITNDEGKMSKSKGDVVDPRVLIKRYGADAVRFFLMKEIVLGHDSKYSHELFLNFYNSYLVNDLGNLLSRVLTMIVKYNDSKVPKLDNNKLSELEKSVVFDFKTTINDFKIEMDQHQITSAINITWQLVSRMNKLIDVVKPWDLYKNGKKEELNNTLNLFANGLLIISSLLSPILVDTNLEINKQLGVGSEVVLNDDFDLNNIVDKVVSKEKLLFKRLVIEEELEYLNNL